LVESALRPSARAQCDVEEALFLWEEALFVEMGLVGKEGQFLPCSEVEQEVVAAQDGEGKQQYRSCFLQPRLLLVVEGVVLCVQMLKVVVGRSERVYVRLDYPGHSLRWVCGCIHC
jgi:hypothetical protein